LKMVLVWETHPPSAVGPCQTDSQGHLTQHAWIGESRQVSAQLSDSQFSREYSNLRQHSKKLNRLNVIGSCWIDKFLTYTFNHINIS
jgi:hypothetical protein